MKGVKFSKSKIAKRVKISKEKRKAFSSIRETFDKHPVVKFLTVFLLVVGYFIFATRHYGLKEGFFMSILSWSFFVFCTPIADAGILIDFPVRLITGIKMIYSEMAVWVFAALINITAFIFNPGVYDDTILLSLFKYILTNPFPYWGIIILSAIGTFLSVHLADRIADAKKMEKKHHSLFARYRIILYVVLVLLAIVLYNFLLNKLGINIPLI